MRFPLRAAHLNAVLFLAFGIARGSAVSFVGAIILTIVSLYTLTAMGANLTWDNGASTGKWNTTDLNFTSGWTNGNTAVFGGLGSETVTINEAGISATGVTFNVTGDTIAATGANNLTLTTQTVTVGSGLTATINAPLAGGVGVQVEGGGTLNLTGISTIDGGSDGSKGLVVGTTSANNTVSLSSGGTMGTIGLNRRSLFIGSSGATAGLSTTGSNIVNISTPGTSGSPSFNTSGNGTRMTIGYASASNELNISNGAYFAQTNGGGTNTWDMGVLDTGNSNVITIAGTGAALSTQLVFVSNMYINVGTAGSTNSVTVSNGGFFRVSRFGVGVGTGDNNSVVITGANSEVRGSAGTNSFLDVGTVSGGTGNNIQVAAGGTLNFGGSGNSRRWAVGQVAGADTNYIQITGANSRANMVHTGIPLAIGGIATGANVLTDGGTGNHLDVYNGGTLDLDNLDASNVNIPTGSMAVSILGTDSAFNLGNGTGLSTAFVGGTTNFASGVFLKNSSGRLNINGGKLVAGVDGALVSGNGAIVLDGAGFFSTAFAGSTISTNISGVGYFTKEGTGLLTLSGANTYTGDTSILAGTLSISSAFLADAAAVRLSTGSLLNLNFSGSDTINTLWLDGTQLPAGSYDSSYGSLFTGTGSLLVSSGVVVPEPGTLALLVSAIAFAGFRYRRRSAVVAGGCERL